MHWKKSLRLVFSLWTLAAFVIVCVPSFIWIRSEMLKLRQVFTERYSMSRAVDIKNRAENGLSSRIRSCFQMAESPAVRDWLANEYDPVLRTRAFGTFGAFSRNMENKPDVYAVVAASQRYYLANTYRSTVSRENPVDDWYFDAVQRTNNFTLAVDYDPSIAVTRFWINVPVRRIMPGESVNPELARRSPLLGVVGTGLDVSVFLKDLLEIDLPGAFVAFFDAKGSVQAYRDIKFINSSTVFMLLDVPEERTSLSNAMRTMRDDTTDKIPKIASLALEHRGIGYHATLTWIPTIRWFALVFIDTADIISFTRFLPLIGTIATALTGFFLSMIFFTNRRLIQPIVRLAAVMHRMQDGDLEIRAEIKSNDEIGELAHACNVMADEINGYTARLEDMVRRRTEELVRRNHEIVDSLSYARLIQSGILPRRTKIAKHLPQHSLIWRPRDIVSGDFYWFKSMENALLVAVADCTGHGVPGAFMMMTANSVLDHVFWYINDDPAAMLMELDRLMRQTLNQDEGSEGQSNDGLDIGLVLIKPATRSLVYSGARIPAFLCHEGHVEMIRGDKQSIGYARPERVLSFAAHERVYAAGDRLFFSTDGFFDQTDPAGKAFGTTRFVEMLTGTLTMTLEEQRNHVLMELERHAERSPQLDDITVLGIGLP